jgi:hypothetical protein
MSRLSEGWCNYGVAGAAGAGAASPPAPPDFLNMVSQPRAINLCDSTWQLRHFSNKKFFAIS